jgi:RHS repeat-associated protein
VNTPFNTTFEKPEGVTDLTIQQRPDPRLVPPDSVVHRNLFHGRPLDGETGLYYFRNRYYDPELGRFTSVDPLGYVDGPSMYGFAMNSPTNYVDPIGKDAFIIRFGPGSNETDVYVTLRFLRSRQDSAMTDARFFGAQSTFVQSSEQAWSALRPQILFSEPNYLRQVSHHGRTAYEWESPEEAFVTDVILETGAFGRSNSRHFFIDRIGEWGYAHEFGHQLGLDDYYREITERNPQGGLTHRQVPDVQRFGKRAVNSIMGNKGRMPVAADLRDIRDPQLTMFELPAGKEPIHHLDISAANISSVVQFFETVGLQRGVNLDPQLDLLRQKSKVEERRFLVRWVMSLLFRPGPVQ